MNICEAYLVVNSQSSRYSRGGFFSIASIKRAMACSDEQFLAHLRDAMACGYVKFDEGTWALADQEERDAALVINGKRVLMLKVI